jgi:hypothetical protein
MQEMKRGLFEVYIRPKQTTINLISTTTSSSAAFPGGEAFDFVFSPKGRWCLALSSSRIFVIDTASPTVSVRRELKVLRRPISASILDDGTRLAVLSTDHKVNLYDLSEEKPQFRRSILLDNPTNTIALSAKGEVLATAYDGGIEVYSLADNAVSTDQRSVKCDQVDALAFSTDGTMLLGTTSTSRSPSTVILSAPYFTEAEQDISHTEFISQMWTSQILFPNSSRDCSHATLLPHQRDGDASWTLTYDSVFESFRAVRTDDLRNGTTYFTGPKPAKSRQRTRSKSKFVPCTLPTINEKGELVAAGFLGNEVWLYGVPEGLDTPGRSTLEDISPVLNEAGPSSALNDHINVTEQESSPEVERLPRWQVLVDKHRNVFAKGKRVAKLSNVAAMCWVSNTQEDKELHNISERLVLAAPGGVSGSSDLEQEELASVDGGRLVILDFDRTIQEGVCDEITIEVGNIAPEMLEEEDTDMATEIALVRRRTVAQRRDVMSRASVVDALRPSPGSEDVPAVPVLPVNLTPGFGISAAPTEPTLAEQDEVSPSSPVEGGMSLEEVANALDGPYSHTSPRSRNTLYRSATAVAANRLRNTARIPDSGRVEFRRTDGTELPHESDADNWVPPPPPYTPDADAPLPRHLRMALASGGLVPPIPQVVPQLRPPQRSQTARESPFVHTSVRRRSSVDNDTRPNLADTSTAQRQVRDPVMASAAAAAVSPSAATPSPRVQAFHALTPSSSIAMQSQQFITDRQARASVSALSEISSLDRRSSSSTTGSSTPRRRPVSSFEQRSPSLRGRYDERSTPISTIYDPSQYHRRYTSQPISLPTSPVDRSTPSPALTLSGSNLQQRLDYPLPPPPAPELNVEDPIDRRPSPLDPVDIAHTSVPPSPATPQYPPVPEMPSAYQLNNLQNRYSVSSNSQLGIISTQDLPRPSPPRGALGALGRRTATSPASIEAPAKALSRSNSVGSTSSGRDRPIAASTPNLLRPTAQRLDTIYSVASRTGDDARDIPVPPVPDTRPSSRLRTRSESRLGRRESRWMGRKGRERREVAEARGRETAETEGRDRGFEDSEGRGKKKKGAKCIVM